MRTAIIGTPTCGKSTVFQALTGQSGASGSEASIAAVAVPDPRVDKLASLYQPKKTIHATVEFVDLASQSALRKDGGELGQAFLNAVRPAQILLQVVDGFSLPEERTAFAADAIETVDTELVMADLDQCERRLKRIEKEGARQGPLANEAELLRKCRDELAQGTALRGLPGLALHPELRSFAFLSAKTILTVINTAEDSPMWEPSDLPQPLLAQRQGTWGKVESLCAKLEAEISQLPPDEARAFLVDYGIERPARERIVQSTYGLLGLMSFFTVGPDEVRAWTIGRGTPARAAAGAIHTDIERGFIRAEVCDYATVVELGSFEEAKRQGKMRLEGKDYLVQDGEIVHFRFNI